MLSPRWPLSVLAVAALSLATAGQAAPITVNFSLTADSIGDQVPVFGFSQVPAGPFSGSFSVEAAGWAPNSVVFPTLLAFDLTLGNQHFGLSGHRSDLFQTDALGQLDLSAAWYVELLTDLMPNQHYEHALWIGNSPGGNFGWFAIDHGAQNGCSFDVTPPYSGVVAGACIGGLPSSVQFSVDGAGSTHAAPEPATPALLLAAAGLAGLWHRRRGG